MTRSDLDTTMRALLVQLSTCSHARAAAWGAAGTSRSSDDALGGNRPPGDLGHEAFARRYGPPFHDCTPWCQHRARPAETDEERRDVVNAARDELHHLRGRDESERPEGETYEQMIVRMLEETQGSLPEVIATSHFRISARVVRRERARAGLDQETGHALDAPGDLSATDRQALLRKLTGEGFTLAYAARRAGVHRSTAERDLGRRAA